MEEVERMYRLASEVKENISINEAEKIKNRLGLFYSEAKDVYNSYFMETLEKIETIDLKASTGLSVLLLFIHRFTVIYEFYKKITANISSS